MAARAKGRDWGKLALFLAGLGPLAGLVWLGLSGGLGAEPIKATIHYTGNWALRMLILALAVTPFHRATGLRWIMAQRRMIGLFAYLYVTLHMLSYVGLDQFFHWPTIGEDIVKRPFISIGMAAFVMLTALAVTSTRRAVRRLGGKRWQALHRLVYVAVVAGGLHFLIGVKADITEPLIYLAVIAFLLGLRFVPMRSWASMRGGLFMMRTKTPSNHPG
jgi:sulfoxide reductase heme-binding subunit YedZ